MPAQEVQKMHTKNKRCPRVCIFESCEMSNFYRKNTKNAPGSPKCDHSSLKNAPKCPYSRNQTGHFYSELLVYNSQNDLFGLFFAVCFPALHLVL